MISSGTNNLLPIEADDLAATEVIGAKARSLQQMTAFGLRIPSGFILTTGFFQPWFDIIQHSPSWDAWRTGTREMWPALCAAMKADALKLPFSDLQLLTLEELSERLAKHGPSQRFAVRSSSPDEDTATASFAGLYETELGRSPGELKTAIRRCFSACFDHRVFAYKAARCMDVEQLSIALIIQVQIDSDVAGVGFSVNPLTNDYDETVIDANWGLGESVVAGTASPDHFVVDKVKGTVVEWRLGAKQASVVLAAATGTTTAPHPQRGAYCLTEAQLLELSTAISGLETMYGHPVDMEWGYANGKLSILQARPITTYVPLPAEIVTMPGARRALYMDIALSKGMTSNAAISPIGLDWLAGDMALMLAHCTGNGRLDVKSPAGLLYLGGRGCT
ncbi:PEP/pyruvate-binding domain-containing protein [Massilia sp. DJPM01]|uniref:PEP/pyruvate-binding domain-containing protein n=1 Tax=Massilia sp. DJPM01 TaxID=3024404 RepID=UPI00259E4E22|nr:PEP/pyruvate-binding domain-containing protein [Massilia sp. DJPM01]MDM5180022.1 PEP/pyruvate-binding domain-containing protein [Massilia sp. DJPM01]